MKRKRTVIDKFLERQRAYQCPQCHGQRDVVHVSEGCWSGLELACAKCGDRTRWTTTRKKSERARHR